MSWAVFEFTSGACPFIATEKWRRKQVLRACNRLGYGVRKSVTPLGLVCYEVKDGGRQ